MIDCTSPDYREIHQVKCSKCGGKIAFFWDHQYWCQECGNNASLVKLLEDLILRQNFFAIRLLEGTQIREIYEVYNLIETNFIPKLEVLEKRQNILAKRISEL